MICYTLQGPRYKLEIHDDKIRLIRRAWWSFLSRRPKETCWGIQTLSSFDISVPQYILWGKLEWQDFEGTKGAFRFSTNTTMVKKIVKYLQKRIVKNYQAQSKIIHLPPGRKIPEDTSTAA